MPGDTLFSDAIQGQEAAGQQQVQNNKNKQAENDQGADTAEQGGIQALHDKLSQLNNEVTISPQMALGLVKNTGDKEWLKATGQKMRADVLLSFFKDGINKKIAGKVFSAPYGDKKISFTMAPDQNGEFQPSIIASGDLYPPKESGADTPKDQADRASKEKIAGIKAGAGGAKPKGGTDSPDKDADKWFKNAESARKEIESTFNKKGGMPKSGWQHDLISKFSGGDPANDAKIAGLKQNYSDYKTAVENYNAIAEKSGKSPINVDPSVSSAMDKIMSLPGAKGKPDDQAVSDYLKKSNARDTPANRKWAEEQLSGK